MPFEVIMPKVDMDMTSGTLMAWHVAEGTIVTKGMPIFDIETDKAAMEVESPADGALHHMVPEGTNVPIGQPVAWLFAPDEPVGTAPDKRLDATAEPLLPEPAGHVSDHKVGDLPPGVEGSDSGLIRATPLARKRAQEVGVDIAMITGSGPRRTRAVRRHPRRLGSPASVHVDFVPDTGPLAVTRSRGGTGTPIVLIHGFAGDGLSFAPLNSHLSHRPMIRIELPGHGASPRLVIRSFADLLGHVRQCFDSLNLEQAHLVGHSLGGALAIGLADTRPRRIASMSLLAPAGWGQTSMALCWTVFAVPHACKALDRG